MFTHFLKYFQGATALILALLLLSVPAQAQDAILTSDVPMDVTAESATAAREKAMKDVEREALSALLDKLGAKEKASIMQKLEDDTISAMVKGVEVLDEKMSGNRYRATLRVSYNALAVNTLLGTQEPPPEDGSTPPPPVITSSSTLIIPVYDEDGIAVLWEKTNPWRDMWKRATTQISGGNLLVPYGDPQDIAVASTEATATADFNALLPFFKRYGVGEIVIVHGAYKSGNRTIPASLTVTRRHISQSRTDSFMMDYRPDEGEDKEAMLLRAAKDLAAQVAHQREELVASQALASTEGDGRLMVLVPMRSLDAWTEVRKRLATLQTITHMEMLAISPEQVDVTLRYKGPSSSLANDIRSLGLRVVESDNYWIISKD